MAIQAAPLAALVTPALLYLGAGLVAAPILIHLLARRRFRRVRWAAMEFLVIAQRQNRRRVRMEEWILLALRCSAVLLLGLMAARPFLRPAGAAWSWGGSRRAERMFVLDDSLSMGYGSQGVTSFDRGKQAVRRLIEGFRKTAPEDTVTLVRTSSDRQPTATATYLDDAQSEELLARLEALTPSQRTMDPATVVEGVVEVLERSPDLAGASIYWISDFQRSNWLDDEAAAGGSIFAPLQEWAGRDRGLQLTLVNVGDRDAANTAVVDLSLEDRQAVVGTAGALQATIAHYAGRPAMNLEIQSAVGNVIRPPKIVRELGARERAVVDLEATFARPGYEWVRVSVPTDGLPLDNVRHLTADVVGGIRTLLINGEPSADSHDDEVTFLATALRPEGPVSSGYEPMVVDEAELEATRLSDFHLVVLANVYRLSEAAATALERYVREGGGLIVFLGDQIDPAWYNAAWYRGGEGPLPGELTQIVRVGEAVHLVVTDRMHPAMTGLSKEGDPLGLGRIPFVQFVGCIPIEESVPRDEEGGESAGSGSGGAIGPARVIARFDDAEASPAIVERSFGLGRVALITTTADKEWHDWPDHPTYLPVLMELAAATVRRGSHESRHLVGVPLEHWLDPAVYEPDVAIRTPSYPAAPEAGATAAPDGEDARLALNWEHTDLSGVYQFILRRRDGGQEARLVAVNVDPAESNLARAEERELRQAMPGVLFEYVDELDKLAGAPGESRRELWRLFLFAAAGVLLLEQGLAYRWGKKR